MEVHTRNQRKRGRVGKERERGRESKRERERERERVRERARESAHTQSNCCHHPLSYDTEIERERN